MSKKIDNPDQAGSKWKDVPTIYWQAWQSLFQSSREGLKITGPCPVCGQPELHRWYLQHKPQEREDESTEHVARGGLWEWCRACRSYAHYQAAVPEWWACELDVDTERLTPYPTVIEEAIRKEEEETVRKELILTRLLARRVR